jgi:hypothetical protein
MDPVDPAIISQLSRRKLRGSPCDERRDRNNLRRLVLIQNSLVSISPCASPSRSSPGGECECEDATREERQRYAASTSTAAPAVVEDSYLDDDGFGYIFPDLSLYNEDDDDEDDSEEEDYGVSSNTTDAESDWLEAVLSDLGDEPAVVVEPPRNLERPSSPIPIHTAYGGPRYPLPRPPLELDLPSASPPSHDAEEESPSALDDGLPPYFDADDRSSIYSDESSEPATPFSHSLLRSGLPEPVSSEGDSDDNVGVVTHHRHYSLAHSGLGDDVENRDSRAAVVVMPITSAVAADDRSAVTLFKNGQQLEREQQQQQQQQLPHDYFLCHHFSRRPYDTF